MTFNYNNMQKTASRLMKRFNQGAIQYEQAGAMSGDPWNPVQGAPTLHAMDATVSGVAQEYVDGSTVLASDLMVSAGVFGALPDMSGAIIIDGKRHSIVRIMPKPAAGVTVAWGFIVRA